MSEPKILLKKIDSFQIASLKTCISSRDEIPALIDKLTQIIGNQADLSSPMVIFHGGAVKEGFLVEAAFPVTHPIESQEVHSRLLEPVSVLSLEYIGSHQSIRETVLKIYDFIEAHACTTSLFRREIYHKMDAKNPSNNKTEIQVVLHSWDQLFMDALEQEFGSEVRAQFESSSEVPSEYDSFNQYTKWIETAIHHLDTLTDDSDKKCRVVSHCAHVFPQERIDYLKKVYEANGVNAVLQEMYTDDFWYEHPIRHANVIYMRKNPYDPEGYQNGATPFERRKAYCHCSFVHPYLEQIPSSLSPTFCYCGAGWYTRLWQGIIGKPVKIQHVETLLRGNDQCTLTITLPMDLSGDYPKE